MSNFKDKVGTNSHCSKCKIKKNCCCDFNDGIDDIIITTFEKEKIINRVGKSSQKYFKKINDKTYNIINLNG